MLEAAELRLMLDALEGKEVPIGRTDEETGEPRKVTLSADRSETAASRPVPVGSGYNGAKQDSVR